MVRPAGIGRTCTARRLGLTTLSLCDLELGTRTVVGRPGETISEQDRAAFNGYFREHPLVRYHGTHSRGPTQRITDCVSRKVPFLLVHTERATLVRAVLLYRSKFSDCPAGAVPNSYPKLDLLWDNVIVGPGDGPALRC